MGPGSMENSEMFETGQFSYWILLNCEVIYKLAYRALAFSQQGIYFSKQQSDYFAKPSQAGSTQSHRKVNITGG